MSKHMEVKHKIKEINSKIIFNELLDKSMLSDKEKQLLILYYVNGKNLNFIADEMGYSLASAKKIHKKALQKLEALL